MFTMQVQAKKLAVRSVNQFYRWKTGKTEIEVNFLKKVKCENALACAIPKKKKKLTQMLSFIKALFSQGFQCAEPELSCSLRKKRRNNRKKPLT